MLQKTGKIFRIMICVIVAAVWTGCFHGMTCAAADPEYELSYRETQDASTAVTLVKEAPQSEKSSEKNVPADRGTPDSGKEKNMQTKAAAPVTDDPAVVAEMAVFAGAVTGVFLVILKERKKTK